MGDARGAWRPRGWKRPAVAGRSVPDRRVPIVDGRSGGKDLSLQGEERRTARRRGTRRRAAGDGKVVAVRPEILRNRRHPPQRRDVHELERTEEMEVKIGYRCSREPGSFRRLAGRRIARVETCPAAAWGGAGNVAQVHVRQVAARMMMAGRIHPRSQRVDGEREQERHDEALPTIRRTMHRLPRYRRRALLVNRRRLGRVRVVSVAARVRRVETSAARRVRPTAS